MPDVLRILHLEDEATDAELVERELKKSGIACSITRLKTKDAFLSTLAERPPDLILADYTVPSFDGFAALALAQTQCPDVPFIFVSGTIGEERAIETMKGGATDYVLKHRLSRLGPVVQRALKEAEDRKVRQRMEQLKSELLDVLSHELRTPLAIIQEGVSQLADGLRGSIDPDQQESCRVLTGSLERLNAIFKKVLLVTKVVTGQLECSTQPVDVSQIVRGVEAALRPVADAVGVTLHTEGNGSPAPSMGDRKLLEVALRELVENAIQATPQGGTATVRCVVTPGGTELSVEDTGRGISEQDLPTLFERFRWVGGVDDRKTGGLGLGLFIAKAIIQAHGGSIGVSSVLDQGTRMVIHLNSNAQRDMKERVRH